MVNPYATNYTKKAKKYLSFLCIYIIFFYKIKKGQSFLVWGEHMSVLPG